MDARWGAVDLNGVAARSAAPWFLLDGAGQVAFANPALHRLFGIADGDRAEWRTLAAGPLRPPAERPDAGPQRAARPAETAAGRQWLELLFVPLKLDDGGPLGTLGLARPAAAPAELPTAPDAAAVERLERLNDEMRAKFGFADVPARGAAMRRAIAQTKLAADARCSAAFVGPPGSGKLTLAKLAAHHAPRPRGMLRILDAAALPPERHRDALFGPQGAFQGSVGTLVVRHAGRLALDLQHEVARHCVAAGGGWRLLATELRDWDSGAADGVLHPEFQALANPLVVRVPALSEREEDFPDLVAALLRAAAPNKDWIVEPAALVDLRKHAWPGNVRELAAALAEIAGRSEGARVGPGDIPRRLAPPVAAPAPLPALDTTLEAAERDLLRAAAARFRGNRSKAAEALGISRARFLRRWEQLGLGGAKETAE